MTSKIKSRRSEDSFDHVPNHSFDQSKRTDEAMYCLRIANQCHAKSRIPTASTIQALKRAPIFKEATISFKHNETPTAGR